MRATPQVKKNKYIRAWVLSEWEIRSDLCQSKNSFGKQYAQLVKKKYEIAITSETISRDWLPKG